MKNLDYIAQVHLKYQVERFDFSYAGTVRKHDDFSALKELTYVVAKERTIFTNAPIQNNVTVDAGSRWYKDGNGNVYFVPFKDIVTNGLTKYIDQWRNDVIRRGKYFNGSFAERVPLLLARMKKINKYLTHLWAPELATESTLLPDFFEQGLGFGWELEQGLGGALHWDEKELKFLSKNGYKRLWHPGMGIGVVIGKNSVLGELKEQSLRNASTFTEAEGVQLSENINENPLFEQEQPINWTLTGGMEPAVQTSGGIDNSGCLWLPGIVDNIGPGMNPPFDFVAQQTFTGLIGVFNYQIWWKTQGLQSVPMAPNRFVLQKNGETIYQEDLQTDMTDYSSVTIEDIELRETDTLTAKFIYWTDGQGGGVYLDNNYLFKTSNLLPWKEGVSTYSLQWFPVAVVPEADKEKMSAIHISHPATLTSGWRGNIQLLIAMKKDLDGVRIGLWNDSENEWDAYFTREKQHLVPLYSMGDYDVYLINIEVDDGDWATYDKLTIMMLGSNYSSWRNAHAGEHMMQIGYVQYLFQGFKVDYTPKIFPHALYLETSASESVQINATGLGHLRWMPWQTKGFMFYFEMIAAKKPNSGVTTTDLFTFNAVSGDEMIKIQVVYGATVKLKIQTLQDTSEISPSEGLNINEPLRVAIFFDFDTKEYYYAFHGIPSSNTQTLEHGIAYQPRVEATAFGEMIVGDKDAVRDVMIRTFGISYTKWTKEEIKQFTL